MTDEPIATLYRKLCPSCARQYARDSRACPFCGYAETMSGDQEEDQERLYGEYLVARYRQYQDEAKRLRREAAQFPNEPSRTRVLAQVDAEIASLERDLKAYQDKVRLEGGAREVEPLERIASVHHEKVRPEVRALEPEVRALEPEVRALEPEVRALEPEVRALEPEVRAREPEVRVREIYPPERAVGDKVCPACTATVPHVIERCACGHVFGTEVMVLSVCPHCTASVEVGAARCSCGYPLTVGASLSTIPGLSKR